MFDFHFFLDVLKGTPTWVWVVLGYLIVIGILAFKKRVVSLPKLFIIPVVLTAINYNKFLQGSYSVWAWYLLCLLAAIYTGYLSATRIKVKTFKGKNEIELPGNKSTLILLLSFFCFKYFFGYLHATHQMMAAEYLSLEVSVSGIFSGYFLGKAIRFLSIYRNA